MNDALNNLPSVRNMVKLIVLLLLALIAISLVVAIVKVLTPLIIIGAIVVGGVYLYRQLQEKN
jgi:hypothetical protein